MSTTIVVHTASARESQDAAAAIRAVLPDVDLVIEDDTVRATSSDEEMALFVSERAATTMEREVALAAFLIDTLDVARVGDPGFYVLRSDRLASIRPALLTANHSGLPYRQRRQADRERADMIARLWPQQDA